MCCIFWDVYQSFQDQLVQPTPPELACKWLLPNSLKTRTLQNVLQVAYKENLRLTWKGLTREQVLGIEDLDSDVGVHMQLFMFRVGMFFSTQEEAFQACAGLHVEADSPHSIHFKKCSTLS